MNEEALKMVGPSFEETKADTKGAEVSPDTDAMMTLLSLAVVTNTVGILTGVATAVTKNR